MTKFKALHYIAKFRKALQAGISAELITQSINEVYTGNQASSIKECLNIAVSHQA